MATLDELSVALRNADAAGDADAARMLAAEIIKLRAAALPNSVSAKPNSVSANRTEAEFGFDQSKAAPDKYRQTVEKETAERKAKGIDTSAGLARLGIQGATFNTADEILAGALTPFEMAKRGTLNPAEAYRYAKAQQDLDLEEGRKNLGGYGTAADIAGGVLSGTGLARGGVTAARFLGQNAGLLPRSAAAAADAGALGAVAGAGEGNSLEERARNAAFGGTVGGLLGGATPTAAAAAGKVLSPLLSNVRARVNPEGYARSQVARAMNESSITPQQAAGNVAAAAGEGQPMYTLAEALGDPGQKMLRTVTRAPGPGRTDVAEFLDARQAGQGRRVANQLAEGFDSPMTAQQAEAALTQARKQASDRNYAAARQGAGPVNLTPVIANIDQTLFPKLVGPEAGIGRDSIESVLEGFRARMTNGQTTLTDFTAVQRLRGDLADAVDSAIRSGNNNRARLLGSALNRLDTAMADASPLFRQAQAEHAARSRVINAVGEGRTAALRGRTENTIPDYQARPVGQQAAFRTGYVDPLIEAAQGAPLGVNKARPLTSDAFRAEAAAMAPGNARMQRQLGREMDMFQTRNLALGGSPTADILADQGAMGVDPSLVANVLSGNWGGAARGLLSAGSNMLTGYTPAVRQEVGRLLTMRGATMPPQTTRTMSTPNSTTTITIGPNDLERILQEAVDNVRRRGARMGLLGRAGAGGLAIATQRL